VIHTRGIARNTPAIRSWLESNPAVERVVKINDTMLEFIFDPAKREREPAETEPDGVFFDLTKAPF